MRGRGIPVSLCLVSVLLTAAIGASPLAVTGAGLGEATLSAGIENVQAPPGPASSPIVGFLASTEVQNPPAETVTARNLISPSVDLDVDQLPSVNANVPYRTFWTTSVDFRPGFQVHNTGGHVPSVYGTVDVGTPVHEGDTKRVAVGLGPSEPLFPPRQTTSGGELAWEAVEPVRLQASTDVGSPDGGRQAAQTTAVGFMATLRVDGGGLTAEDDVVSPTLDVAIPNFDPSVFTFTKPITLPKIDHEATYDVSQDEDGTAHVRIQVSVGEGSEWPRSGDEDPSGTWKLRIRVAGTGQDTAAQTTATSASALHVLDLGPRMPGTRTQVIPSEGEARTIEPGPHARIAATDDGRIEEIQVDPWPRSQATSQESPGASQAASAASAGQCTEGIKTPAHAEFLPEGQIALTAKEPGIYAVCMEGEDVGEIGLASVTVDGEVHVPELVDPAAAVYKRSFGTENNPGAQLTVVMEATAGPVAFEAHFVGVHWGDPGIRPWLWDMHALDGNDHTVQFNWLADPDPGANERFLVAGEVPQLIEGPIASEGLAQAITGNPHEVVADGPLTAELRPALAKSAYLFARHEGGDAVDLLAPPLDRTVPPEPLLGQDVATIWPTIEAGTHNSWPYGLGDAYAIPFVWTVSGL